MKNKVENKVKLSQKERLKAHKIINILSFAIPVLAIHGYAMPSVADLLKSWLGFTVPYEISTVVVYFWFALVPIAFISAIVFLCVFWKKQTAAARGACFGALIIANPFFIFFHFLLCFIVSRTLADLSWM